MVGFRLDGRRVGEIRKIQCKIGVLSHADGSSYLEQGNTKVICAVFGPREVESKMASLNYAIINCECSTIPHSASDRVNKSKNSRRNSEISSLVKQTFESVVLTHLFPKSQIDIHLQVIYADGGTSCASVNATTLAMVAAGIPIKDFAIGCNVGYYGNAPVADLNHMEYSLGIPNINLVVLPHTESVVTLQLDCKASSTEFSLTLQAAIKACHAINKILQDCVSKYVSAIAASRDYSN